MHYSIDEVIDFIRINHPVLSKYISKDIMAKLFIENPEGLYVNGNGKINIVSYYYRLNEYNYKLLKRGDLDILDVEIISRLLISKGRNIHVVLIANIGGFKNIYKGIKEVVKKEKAKTISWFEPDFKRIQIFKIKEN